MVTGSQQTRYEIPLPLIAPDCVKGEGEHQVHADAWTSCYWTDSADFDLGEKSAFAGAENCRRITSVRPLE
jgi:hypothetical protein